MWFFVVESFVCWGITVFLAKKYERNIILWAILGAFFGSFALIALVLSLYRHGDLSSSKANQNEVY